MRNEPKLPASQDGTVPVPRIRSPLSCRTSPLCCRTVGISVESESSSIAAFFDLDKAIISRSSTLAFGPPLYRHGLISKSAALRAAFGQLAFRLAGPALAGWNMPARRSASCAGARPADLVSAIVSRHLAEEILPYVYAEAEALLAAHRDAGEDTIRAGGGRADRGCAGRDRDHRHPDGGRRRLRYGRDRFLRLRRSEGQQRARACRRPRTPAARLSRLTASTSHHQPAQRM